MGNMGRDLPEQLFIYEEKGNSAVIWRCFSHEEDAVIPETLAELPVTELAPYCFSAHMERAALERGIQSGKLRIAGAGAFNGEPDQVDLVRIPELCGERLKQIVIAETVSRVGRYCFYNCEHLEHLEFYGKLADWGSGVFTGCHQVCSIRLHLDAEGRSMLKEVLDELHESLQVEYLVEEKGIQTENRNDMAFEEQKSCVDGHEDSMEKMTAILTFPEFYEEGVENTPARILETHVHGSGILYRNCFQSRVFDFRQYDRLFPYAKAQEPFEVLARMVTGRLWYPYHLSEGAKKHYEAFAAEEREAFAVYFSERKDLDGIRWLIEVTGQAHPEIYEILMGLAGEKQFVEAVSYLMEKRREQNAGQTVRKKRRYEL